MEDKLRNYIDNIFSETTPSKKTVELKEEMIQNLTDKYNDLRANGKTNEAAYNIAVAGIGDVSELLNELEEEYMNNPIMTEEMAKAKQKSALLTAVAVMLYILSPLTLIVLQMWNVGNDERIGIPVLFVMAAVATGLLIYNNMTKPQSLGSKDTMVEEFREWQSDEKDRKRMRKAISSALWTLILVAYFVISFTTFQWHLTWIIFLVGAALEALMNVFFEMKNK